MTQVTLHYIYDPYCGWCYAAAPLVSAARKLVRVVGHAGGMMTGSRKQYMSPALREYVIPHDRRIAELTGQPFGDAYFEGLLRDTSVLLDSALPIAAILAAEGVNSQGLDMLSRLQTAHYVDGKAISDVAVQAKIAHDLGINDADFAKALEQVTVSEHITESRRLLNQLGGSGFPTFALVQGGTYTVIEMSQYLGNIPAWEAMLTNLTQATSATPDGMVCGLDGCAT